MESEIYDFVKKHKNWNIEGVWNGKERVKAKTIDKFWEMYRNIFFVEEFFKDLLKEKDLPERLRNEIILCLACHGGK